MWPVGPQHVGADAKPSGLTRRQILVRGLLATGGFLISGAFVRFAALLRESPSDELSVLSPRETVILGALLTSLFPEGGELPAADPRALTPRIDRYLARSDADARLLFRTMLHVIEDQALVFRWTRFSRCSLEWRADEIRAWELTPIYTKRLAFRTVKIVIGMHYFEQAGVREALGWHLGCSPEHLDPIPKQGLG